MARFARAHSPSLLLGVAGLCALSTHASAEQPIPGSGPQALPAVFRVGVAGAPAPRWALASSAAYGWTESVGAVPGSHHRLSGRLAAAAWPLPWLAGALVLDGRHDWHPSDALGKDTSLVGDPRIVLRASRRVGGFGVGAELVGWFPGSEAPSLKLDATTLDLRALLSWWHPAQSTALAAFAGYRFDQSANSAGGAEHLRSGDRISLGVSSFDALLVGLGVSHSLGRTQLLAETTGEWLLGKGAPDVTDSPWRLALGARANLTDALAIDLVGELLLSGRPGVAPTDALVPIEPRLTVGGGLRYTGWGEPTTKPPPVAMPSVAPPAPSPTPVAKAAVQAPAKPPLPEEFSWQGRITDQSGQVLDSAHVILVMPDRKLEASTAADGTFSFENLPAGAAELRVEAPGYVTLESRITTGSAMPSELVLESALPAGQLRGLIRSFAGTPLNARVQVEPGGASATTDPEGRFELDLAPGKYQVAIEADGYLGQKKNIVVEERGVTVINAELEGKR